MTEDVEVGTRIGRKIDDGDVDEVQKFTSAPKRIDPTRNTVLFRNFDYQRKRNRNTKGRFGSDDSEVITFVETPGTPSGTERSTTTRRSLAPSTTRPYRDPAITGIQNTQTGSQTSPTGSQAPSTGTGSEESPTGSQRFLTTIQTASPTERPNKDVKVEPVTNKQEEEERKTSVEEVVYVTEKFNSTSNLSIASTSSSSTTESPPMVENVQRSVLSPEKAGRKNNLQKYI